MFQSVLKIGAKRSIFVRLHNYFSDKKTTNSPLKEVNPDNEGAYGVMQMIRIRTTLHACLQHIQCQSSMTSQPHFRRKKIERTESVTLEPELDPL